MRATNKKTLSFTNLSIIVERPFFWIRIVPSIVSLHSQNSIELPRILDLDRQTSPSGKMLTGTFNQQSVYLTSRASMVIW